ncbi:MAG: hypothetical protein KDH96_04065 [Candidatus Riesia sp.]|nr:hypothetical protein [Candidatus Riesia sp.]
MDYILNRIKGKRYQDKDKVFTLDNSKFYVDEEGKVKMIKDSKTGYYEYNEACPECNTLTVETLYKERIVAVERTECNGMFTGRFFCTKSFLHYHCKCLACGAKFDMMARRSSVKGE